MIVQIIFVQITVLHHDPLIKPQNGEVTSSDTSWNGKKSSSQDSVSIHKAYKHLTKLLEYERTDMSHPNHEINQVTNCEIFESALLDHPATEKLTQTRTTSEP